MNLVSLPHVIVALTLTFGVAHAQSPQHDCRPPARPAIPDGGETTEAELLQAKKQLEAYLRDADRFLVCLRDFENSLGESIAEVDGHALLEAYNQTVDEMYLAGDEFNIALRKFKAANE